MNRKPQILPGDHSLPGVTVTPGGCNVTVVTPAKHAALVIKTGRARRRISLDKYAVGRSRSILLKGESLEGSVYAFFLSGLPDGGKDGLYPDMYARAFARGVWRKTCPAGFDWKGDRFPEIPMKDVIVYEAHVKGFSQTACTPFAGTFRGMEDKIPYLKRLGVNAIELLPVFEADRSCPGSTRRKPLANYWGYSTVGFFAPAADLGSGDPSAELKSLVRALHANGMELWLDVVFNHTGKTGGRLLFEGAGNYYFDEPFANISGCGNTVCCAAPEPARFILDSLEYWRREYRIDGFRFDLCSVLCRDEKGEINEASPLIKAISEDPLLQGCKLIAEPWDAAGGFMTGSFGKTGRWSEWNGRYRDALRKFLTGHDNTAGEAANCIEGSGHLFPSPEASVNFVTCHDGFTLYDLFAYSRKHNLANGENNRDGSDANYSCNMGTEGPSPDPAVEKRRQTFALNALAILMFSKGVPMLLMGDEVLRTKKGNNNTYCQDNPLSWLDWSLIDTRRDVLRTVRELIALRKAWGPGPDSRFTWHGTSPGKPDFSWTSHTLAWEYGFGDRPGRVYAAANMFSESLAFGLPPGNWKILFNTQGSPCVRKSGSVTAEAGSVYILVKENDE